MARHRLDIASLVAGLAFVVIGVANLATDLTLRAQMNLAWPLLLAAIGVTLLLSARGRPDDRAPR